MEIIYLGQKMKFIISQRCHLVLMLTFKDSILGSLVHFELTLKKVVILGQNIKCCHFGTTNETLPWSRAAEPPNEASKSS